MKHGLLRHGGRRARAARGFSLVEVAIGLAVLGLLLAMTFKGQEVYEQYRQGQFVQAVQTLQAKLQAHHRLQGRWPGDCNRDGWLDFPIPALSDLTAATLDYGVPPVLMPAASVTVAYTPGLVCPVAPTIAPLPQANLPYNELKLADLLPAGQPNRQAASHTLGGFIFLGLLDTNPSETEENQFNAMVLTEVSIGSARRLAAAIDGHGGTAANAHRVRRSDDLLNFEPAWREAGETEDTRITVVVFFDRVPPLTVVTP